MKKNKLEQIFILCLPSIGCFGLLCAAGCGGSAGCMGCSCDSHSDLKEYGIDMTTMQCDSCNFMMLGVDEDVTDEPYTLAACVNETKETSCLGCSTNNTKISYSGVYAENSNNWGCSWGDTGSGSKETFVGCVDGCLGCFNDDQNTFLNMILGM